VKVKDVMTGGVVTVTPATKLKAVAVLLAARGISGVPVVDERGAVVGVVSEADVLLKEQGPLPEGVRFPWFRERRDRDAAKHEARTAREAMTSPAITIGPERAVSAAARIMIEHGVNRLPVVKDGRLVGIVTRADLVRAFTRSDPAIAEEIRADVVERAMWLPAGQIEIAVRNGEVELTGEVGTRTDAEVLERLARRVLGVVGVSSRLTWRSKGTDVEHTLAS
jgi:CBS domain-containing protein